MLGIVNCQLLNFDFNMTKFGCSLQVISLPFTSSSSLSIYLQINLHYVSTYSTTSIYGVQYCRYCTVTVFLSTVSTYIFFSLSTCQQCSYIFCVYLSTDLSHCIYAVSIVYIFLQCSMFIYLFYSANLSAM